MRRRAYGSAEVTDPRPSASTRPSLRNCDSLPSGMPPRTGHKCQFILPTRLNDLERSEPILQPTATTHLALPSIRLTSHASVLRDEASGFARCMSAIYAYNDAKQHSTDHGIHGLAHAKNCLPLILIEQRPEACPQSLEKVLL